MKQMTIDEFNKEYGVTTWGYPRYTMVTDEDIGTFVCKRHEGYTIPYFCQWVQKDEFFTMSHNWGETIEIIEG